MDTKRTLPGTAELCQLTARLMRELVGETPCGVFLQLDERKLV